MYVLQYATFHVSLSVFLSLFFSLPDNIFLTNNEHEIDLLTLLTLPPTHMRGNAKELRHVIYYTLACTLQCLLCHENSKTRNKIQINDCMCIEIEDLFDFIDIHNNDFKRMSSHVSINSLEKYKNSKSFNFREI